MKYEAPKSISISARAMSGSKEGVAISKSKPWFTPGIPAEYVALLTRGSASWDSCTVLAIEDCEPNELELELVSVLLMMAFGSGPASLLAEVLSSNMLASPSRFEKESGSKTCCGG